MRPSLLVAAGALWIGAAVASIGVLWNYASRPGASAPAPPRWPAAADRHVLAPDRPTLLVFLHPECPCSQATVAELGRVVARAERPLAVRVFVHDSPEFPRPADQGPLWPGAARIPGVQVSADRDGALARAFGAETSGAALLYDADGRLLFQGGITGARGHEGVNPNEDALLACLRKPPQVAVTTHAYGCSIFSEP